MQVRLESSRGGERVVPTEGRATAMFYEPRERLEDNAALKRALRDLASELSGHLDVVAIGDVADFNFAPARSVVRRVIGALGRANDLEVLLDWEGEIARPPFSLERGKSNVLVVDAQGEVLARHVGVVSEAEISSLVRLLRDTIQASVREGTRAGQSR